MIVLDASTVVELLRAGPRASLISGSLATSATRFIAPHILDVEVLNALRRLAAHRHTSAIHVTELIDQLDSLRIERFPHKTLLRRIWELRHNFTAYDAAYIALAEETGATLYTCDSKLASGHRARVKVFSVH